MAAHRARWPWLLVGGLFALAPLACTASDDLVGVDLPDTTPFRTTLVEIITTTTAPPTTVPSTGSVAPGSTLAPGEGGLYTIVAGDYWIGIAQKVGVTLEALLAANAATTETLLLPGRQVIVPPGGTVAPETSAPPASSSPVSATGGTYTVVAGDYWIGIAQKLNVALDALLAANGATTDTFLSPGQTLNVP
jgi:LysM repeat protein